MRCLGRSTILAGVVLAVLPLSGCSGASGSSAGAAGGSSALEVCPLTDDEVKAAFPSATSVSSSGQEGAALHTCRYVLTFSRATAQLAVDTYLIAERGERDANEVLEKAKDDMTSDSVEHDGHTITYAYDNAVVKVGDTWYIATYQVGVGKDGHNAVEFLKRIVEKAG